MDFFSRLSLTFPLCAEIRDTFLERSAFMYHCAVVKAYSYDLPI